MNRLCCLPLSSDPPNIEIEVNCKSTCCAGSSTETPSKTHVKAPSPEGEAASSCCCKRSQANVKKNKLD